LNILFCGDFHIEERSIEEINSIFDELLIIKDKYCVTKLIIAGDSFDRINPTSKELDCLSAFLKKLNIPIILLAAKSHESTTSEDSIINHFGILKDNIQVCKEYIDGYLFVGHFLVKESKLNYGGTVSKNDLKKYKYVVLGHGHSHELVHPNVCQLGSIRYVDFAEAKDKQKVALLIDDYKGTKEKPVFIPIKSVIPMKDIELSTIQQIIDKKGPQNETTELKSSISRAQETSKTTTFDTISSIIAYLDQLDPKTKVRVIFKDYAGYKEFLPFYQRFVDKFVLFKQKKDFTISINTLDAAKTETTSLKEELVKFLK